MKSVKLIALAVAMVAVHANAFDWPAAGGTATIPAGETVTVTGNDVTTAAACGAIVIEAGATLKFSNITANAKFAGSISGSGTFSAENASDKTYRLTFTGGHTYNNPLDVNLGANYGLQVNSNSLIAGAVTCRGGSLYADNGTMHIKSQVGAISQIRPINTSGKSMFSTVL